MTEFEFTQKSLNLENKIIGLKISMERLRKFFEYALRNLCNKNDAEAKKLFKSYWHQHNHEFRVFHNLSENEIYNLIKKRNTIANASIKLMEMGWKLTYLVNHIQIWRTQGKLVYDALELCRSVQDQKNRKAAQDVQARIEEMKHAKDEMVRVFNLTRQLAVFMAVPFVSDYISMNACIFVELGNLCDKIADYAMRIVKETENALGPKSGWVQVFNEPDSVFNKSKAWAAEEKMKSR